MSVDLILTLYTEIRKKVIRVPPEEFILDPTAFFDVLWKICSSEFKKVFGVPDNSDNSKKFLRWLMIYKTPRKIILIPTAGSSKEFGAGK